MITFENILQMRQEDLKRELKQLLCKQGYEVVSKHGFLYAKGTVPVYIACIEKRTNIKTDKNN